MVKAKRLGFFKRKRKSADGYGDDAGVYEGVRQGKGKGEVMWMVGDGKKEREGGCVVM
jgi:hypothetical protein